ncbi:hypothetical protein RB195_022224 [Necator americanus]|uniref:Uncharacterized protein n=1 Tax=Necator americanus TaxID=51031 RepID=A0ABR1EEF1_NECAM
MIVLLDLRASVSVTPNVLILDTDAKTPDGVDDDGMTPEVVLDTDESDYDPSDDDDEEEEAGTLWKTMLKNMTDKT